MGLFRAHPRMAPQRCSLGQAHGVHPARMRPCDMACALRRLTRRALDLVYALVNEGNIESLTKELLEYLVVADAEFKPDLTAKIAALVQRFAPNKRWHFDSLLQARAAPYTPCQPVPALAP